MPSRGIEAEIAAYAGSPRAYRRWISSLWVCCIMAFTCADAALAGSRHAAMAIDANTGETLHAESADELRHPASLTKMMTIYMVFEQLEAGRLMPATKLKVSQEAASAAPTKLDLEPGEQIAVMDAVKALITKSANDMSIVLAEAIGGTEAKFAELMTQKARSLGMRNTTFRNASGLPDSGQVTTARDMLTLALRLQDDFPKYYPLFATRAFAYNGATHRNHNTLLGTFEGIDGIKTGYTRMSGFNVVTSLRRGEKHIVAAVFGGATAGTRNATMRLVLTRSLLKASAKKTRKPAPVLIARPKLIKPPKVATASPLAVTQPAAPALAKASRPVAALPAKAPVPQMKMAAVPPPLPEAAAPERGSDVARAPIEAPAEPVSATADPSPMETPTPVEIARVRPVMVALRPRPQAPVTTVEDAPTTATPAMSIAAAGFTEAPADARSPGSRVASREPQVAQQKSRPPQTIAFAQPAIAPVAALPAPAQQVMPSVQASLATVRLAPAQVAAAMPEQPRPAVMIQRGAPPSTLQAQAQGLARPALTASSTASGPIAYASLQPPPSRLRGPDVSPVQTSTAGGFHIQIGAYASAAEAEKMLKATQARTQNLLRSASPVTSPVQKESRVLYRARFAGFDARSAADTCLQLRRAAIDCFVMKAD